MCVDGGRRDTAPAQVLRLRQRKPMLTRTASPKGDYIKQDCLFGGGHSKQEKGECGLASNHTLRERLGGEMNTHPPLFKMQEEGVCSRGNSWAQSKR